MSVSDDKSLEDRRISELHRNLDEAQKHGEDIVNIGRGYTREGQFIIDHSNALRSYLQYISPNDDWENLISNFELQNRQSINVIDDASQALISLTTTSGSAAFSSTGTLKVDILSFDPDERKKVQEARDNLLQVTSRFSTLDEIIELMEQFHLDLPPHGKKTPIELLQTACWAYEIPVSDTNPVSTSLIPMRECLEATISKLLQLRPWQEKAKSNWAKIVSTGNQLKRDNIPDEQIQIWASQYHDLIKKELSPAKQIDITRNEWRRRLVLGIIFLGSFMKGLDPSKLK